MAIRAKFVQPREKPSGEIPRMAPVKLLTTAKTKPTADSEISTRVRLRMACLLHLDSACRAWQGGDPKAAVALARGRRHYYSPNTNTSGAAQRTAYHPRALGLARRVLATRSGAPLADHVTPKPVGCTRWLDRSPPKQDPSRCQETVANKICSERANTPIELVSAVRNNAFHAALSGARAMHTARATMPKTRLLEEIRKHNRPAEPRTVVVAYLSLRPRHQCCLLSHSEQPDGPRISRERQGWRGVCCCREAAAPLQIT